MTLAMLALQASGCDGDSVGDDVPTTITGRISTEDGVSHADVATRKAFGLAIQGQGYLYLASGAAATCEKVVDLLTAQKNAYDPTPLHNPEECNLTFDFSFDRTAGWEGAVYTEETPAMGIWSVNCAMDPGEFEYVHQGDESDYYYSGRWFQGSPVAYDLTLHGADQTLSLDLTMQDFTGDFIHEGLQKVPAVGIVTGTGVEVEWCPQLVQTDFFTL